MAHETTSGVHLTTEQRTHKAHTIRVIGLITIIVGALMMLGGGITWGMVSSQLADERIPISEDAPMFAGEQVNGPIDAFIQAGVINMHALEGSGGRTYGEMAQDDPERQTVMTASFLRASLFTSVVAFGLAIFAFGSGLMLVLTGLALRAAGQVLRST
jgi:hypothetical protein